MEADPNLIQIVDGALAEASRLAGGWLVCRLGCTSCCMGTFPISQLDARRLQEGLAALTEEDPARAERVRSRTRAAAGRWQALGEDGVADDPCPALDPATGGCDLYAARPLTCRTFGPPMLCEGGGVAICELCFDGATPEEVAACTVDLDTEALEAPLLAELERSTGVSGETTVALALANSTPAAESPTP